MAVTVETLGGAAMRGVLGELALLRIAVFREWPYLYAGTLGYEQEYLARFAAAQGAVLVVARDGGRVVGAATAAPLRGHTAEFVPLFVKRGLDPDRVFYFGESVLLPTHRGQGIGHAFFDHREAAARAASGPAGPCTHAAFCSVVRPDGHPARPAGYRPLDAFWSGRGYAKVEGMLGSYDWQDVGEPMETAHSMQFWMRAL